MSGSATRLGIVEAPTGLTAVWEALPSHREADLGELVALTLLPPGRVLSALAQLTLVGAIGVIDRDGALAYRRRRGRRRL
jgi:hypothetical protein